MSYPDTLGLGCTMDLHLDGGGSSQLSYKRSIPAGFQVDETYQPAPDTNPRLVYNMVRVNPTSWNSGTGFY